MTLLSSKDVRDVVVVVVVVLVSLMISTGSAASIPKERQIGEGWIINGIPMSIDHVAFNRHTGERPAEDNRITNSNIGNQEPALAVINNVIFNSKPPIPLATEVSLIINEDNVANLAPLVQSLEMPNESVLGRANVEVVVDDVKTVKEKPDLKTETDKQVDDVKTVEKEPGLRTETDKQGSEEIVSDVKPAEDSDLKKETKETLIKDVKVAFDSDLKSSGTETAEQESRPGDVIPDVTKVEDDWGDFEEAFGDEQEVGEGNEEVIDGEENHDDLLHADPDEEVGDGAGLDNDEVIGDETDKDMEVADDNVVI